MTIKAGRQKLKRAILITLTTVFLLSFFVGCIPSALAVDPPLSTNLTNTTPTITAEGTYPIYSKGGSNPYGFTCGFTEVLKKLLYVRYDITCTWADLEISNDLIVTYNAHIGAPLGPLITAWTVLKEDISDLAKPSFETAKVFSVFDTLGEAKTYFLDKTTIEAVVESTAGTPYGNIQKRFALLKDIANHATISFTDLDRTGLELNKATLVLTGNFTSTGGIPGEIKDFSQNCVNNPNGCLPAEISGANDMMEQASRIRRLVIAEWDAQHSDACDGLHDDEQATCIAKDTAVVAAKTTLTDIITAQNKPPDTTDIGSDPSESWVCPAQDVLDAPFGSVMSIFGKDNPRYDHGVMTGLICTAINGGIIGLANIINGWVYPPDDQSKPGASPNGNMQKMKGVLDIYGVTAPDSLAVRIWLMLRDIINSMFVLAFLIMAAINVIGPLIKVKMYEDWKVQKKIPSIVGSIFLVNFSLSIANLVILFGNSITNLFLNNVGVLKASDKIDIGGLGIFYALIIALVLLAVAGLSVYYYIILWVRVIIINILVMFAAAPYIGGILPIKQLSDQTEKWFGLFTKWVFMGPTLAFILYIIFQTINVAQSFGSSLVDPGLDKLNKTSFYQDYSQRPIFASLSSDLATYISNNIDKVK